MSAFDRLVADVGSRGDRMVAELRELVSLESPSEDKRLADVTGCALAVRAQRAGLSVSFDRQERHGDNVVATWSPPGATGSVLLVGHYDTAYPAGTLAARPFRVDGPLAFGPGVFDMKGGLVIGLFAVEAFLQSEVAPRLRITFLMNSDEEPGSPASRPLIRREAARHDLALILEPGRPGPALTIARKGVGVFRVIVNGLEAHAGADPDKGANAIVALAHTVLEIEALADRDTGTTVNPGVVAGGTQPYVVPGHAELAIDIRVETAAERERIERELARIVRTPRVPGTTAELAGSFHRPPLVPSDASKRYVALVQAVSRAVGYPLGTATSGGASDGNDTAAVGTPTVDGVGAHGGRAHSPDEYIELESLPLKSAIVAGFLAALADPALQERLGA